MAILTRCCFSKNLKNGTIASGVWSLVHCVFSLGLSISDIVSTSQSLTDLQSYTNTNTDVMMALFWSSLIVSFFTALASIILFIAVIKSAAKLLLPWLVMVVMQILFDVAGIVFQIWLFGFEKILIGILVAWIMFTLINIYCALCVASHYQELKLGRGTAQDYLGRNRNVRYMATVQHVHIGNEPVNNYITSQHTVYSFHSQTLNDESGKDSPKPYNGSAGAPTALSQCNGRVLELRPVLSMPSNMDTRLGLGGSNYTGSIEMKVVDSIPVSMDTRNLVPYNGNLDVSAAGGRRPRRFRTVSESAVKQPLIKDADTLYVSSLQNMAEQNRASDIPESSAPPTSEMSHVDNDSSSNSGGALGESTLSAGEDAAHLLRDDL